MEPIWLGNNRLIDEMQRAWVSGVYGNNTSQEILA